MEQKQSSNEPFVVCNLLVGSGKVQLQILKQIGISFADYRMSNGWIIKSVTIPEINIVNKRIYLMGDDRYSTLSIKSRAEEEVIYQIKDALDEFNEIWKTLNIDYTEV